MPRGAAGACARLYRYGDTRRGTGAGLSIVRGGCWQRHTSTGLAAVLGGDAREGVLESTDGLLRLCVFLRTRGDGAEGAATLSRQGTPAQDRFERVESAGEEGPEPPRPHTQPPSSTPPTLRHAPPAVGHRPLHTDRPRPGHHCGAPPRRYCLRRQDGRRLTEPPRQACSPSRSAASPSTRRSGPGLEAEAPGTPGRHAPSGDRRALTQLAANVSVVQDDIEGGGPDTEGTVQRSGATGRRASSSPGPPASSSRAARGRPPLPRPQPLQLRW